MFVVACGRVPNMSLSLHVSILKRFNELIVNLVHGFTLEIKYVIIKNIYYMSLIFSCENMSLDAT